MGDNKRKPDIRFQGFTDDWEQRKFSDLVLIERGGSPRPIDDYITDLPDGLNWVKIGDAPSQGRYITKTAEKIKPEGLSKTRQVQPGDLILSNSMSFGKPYIMGINGCIHDGWLLISDTQNRFDLKFLCHMLGTDQMLNQYRMFAAGSTVNNLNKELVGNTTVSLPSDGEQRVIGEYLESVDDLITLQQRKYDKLVNVKKSMLEKMFPREGAKVPEIRFEGFTDDWEQRKFVSVFEGLQNNTLSRADLNYENGTVKNVHYGDVLIKFGDYIDASETNLPYISDDAKADKFKNSFLQDGDIIIADTAEDDTVGKCTEIQGSEGLKLSSG
ncbi:MAG: restriction endonuclease subunit S, partial [Lachnospiraceae bacterium]|nr:restriction endonuclease subunit S [Lachnospiraceae bacterium]